MSIALDVCRIAEEKAGPGQAANVVAVGMDVGDDAGVEVDNLDFWLSVLLTQPPFARGRVHINRQPGDALQVTWLEVDDGHPDD